MAPLRNAVDTIGACLDSVAAQTHAQREHKLVIADDIGTHGMAYALETVLSDFQALNAVERLAFLA